ncbi:MAG: hypothetical protein U0176_07905 [Bacteroidia bacterium]
MHISHRRDSSSLLPAVGTLRIVEGPVRPESPSEGTVFVPEKYGHSFSIYRNGKWEVIYGADVKACNDLLYFHPIMHAPGPPTKLLRYVPDQESIEVYSFSTGESLPVTIRRVEPFGQTLRIVIPEYVPPTREDIDAGIRIKRYEYSYVVVDARPGLPSKDRLLTSGLPHESPQWTPCTVQGKKAYCLPKYVPGLETYSPRKSLYNWGMMGEDGQWLITPEFARPFTFIDGCAEVIHHGKNAKINEKGEVVE